MRHFSKIYCAVKTLMMSIKIKTICLTFTSIFLSAAWPRIEMIHNRHCEICSPPVKCQVVFVQALSSLFVETGFLFHFTFDWFEVSHRSRDIISIGLMPSCFGPGIFVLICAKWLIYFHFTFDWFEVSHLFPNVWSLNNNELFCFCHLEKI